MHQNEVLWISLKQYLGPGRSSPKTSGMVIVYIEIGAQGSSPNEEVLSKSRK